MDLTVAAIPFYFGSMGAEAWRLKQTRDPNAPLRGGEYEKSDTIASLSMGVASLLIPLASRPLSRKLDPLKHRTGRIALGVAGGAAVAAVAADAWARRNDLAAGEVANEPAESVGEIQADHELPETSNRKWKRLAKKVAGNSVATALVTTGAVAAGTWASRTMAQKLFTKRVLPDWGDGVVPALVAIAGWDFIYYWNHRLMHETRFMWAIHVVHHSSEHYNLSTALRQPVADALGMFVPYGLLSLLGIRPSLIEQARGINLIYQFWIHTEIIRTIGPAESVLNTASHHRVHHGSNKQYLDRNHGSILIIWDKLFGTFEPEGEPVVYGLTKNIDTYNPLRIITHEYTDIAHDVSESETWEDRLSYVFRGPGWAYEHHGQKELAEELVSR